MIKSIKICGDPVLRRKSDPVEKVDSYVRNLVADMFDTMYHDRGVGLAAVQVGVPLRLFLVDTSQYGGGRLVLINPKITFRDGVQVGEEGCLSVPGLVGEVSRAYRVGFEATGLDGEPITGEATDLTARALQHENDHTDGILFVDRLSDDKRRAIAKQLKRFKKQWKRMERGEVGIESVVEDLDRPPDL
jgi:peptide deformylase